MAWEQRRNKLYYYRTKRVDGKVVKKYFGSGIAACQAAEEDARRKQQRAEERARLRKLQEQWESAAAPADELHRGCDLLVQAILLCAGFHRPNSNAWRKKMKQKQTPSPEAATAENSTSETANTDELSYDELLELVKRAAKGDEQVMPRLRAHLDSHPRTWQGLGDVAKFARKTWIQRSSGEDLFIQECVTRQAEALRQELLGESPGPMERLLVDNIVVCWLQLHWCQVIDARSTVDSSIKYQEFIQKRQIQTQKRMDAAMRSLNDLRRLLPARPVKAHEAEVPIGAPPENGSAAKPTGSQNGQQGPSQIFAAAGDQPLNGVPNRLQPFLQPAGLDESQ